MISRCLIMLLVIFCLSGCQTTSQVQRPENNQEDIGEVLSAVAGALSGKPLSKEEFRNLEEQIRTDQEAQKAIETITESVGGKAPEVKYCPVTGRRYASHFEICPEHQVKLKIVGQ